MDRRRFLEGGLSLLALAGSAHSQSRVAIDREELLEFAKEICRIPSFTTEETALARWLDERFRREGFETELQEVDPGRFQCIARLPGSGGGESLMLNGHIDIDPIPEGITRDPFAPFIEGDRFYGAGIGNMKVGVSSMCIAALSARRARLPLKGDLVVACVVGELQGGAGTVHMLKSGVRTDYAIVGEPHGADMIRTKHAGVMQLAIHVIGRMAHISQKELGVNAILKAGKIAAALDALELTGPRDPELPALPLLNVGTILGGRGREVVLRGPNIVPDFCTLYADIRFTDGMTPESIIADIRGELDALAREDPELQYEIEFPMKPERKCLREVMMPLSVSPELPFIQKLASQVASVRGEAPLIGTTVPDGYTGTDTAHLYAAGIPCVVYGPSGRPDGAERYLWASVDEMVSCASVYGAMIEEICA